MVSVSVEHITKTPGVCGYEGAGRSPTEIVEQFPSITLADVHAAIAYYLDHREEIEAESRRAHEVAESYRARFPSKVKGKLGE
jgi:uncharacterized protein (DUF433 family)